VQSSSQIVTTNGPTPSFLQAGCHLPNQQCQSTEEKVSQRLTVQKNFTGRMPFLSPNQWCQGIEGIIHKVGVNKQTAFFALGSFAALGQSLYRCVNCFSVFVVFV